MNNALVPEKAMIFAAGLGTRLRPLTLDRPKAMVEIHGKPLLQIAIEKLADAGIQEIVINVHHFAEVIYNFLDSYQTDVNIIVSDEREQLLETGGGILKARESLVSERAVLVCNVDVLHDLDIRAIYNYHYNRDALATMAIRNRKTSRYLLFDEQSTLCGWENIKTGEQKVPVPGRKTHRMAFSGIQILSQEFLDHLHGQGKFSIIESYLEQAKSERIFGYDHSDGFWLDVGKPESLEKGKQWLAGPNSGS